MRSRTSRTHHMLRHDVNLSVKQIRAGDTQSSGSVHHLVKLAARTALDQQLAIISDRNPQ